MTAITSAVAIDYPTGPVTGSATLAFLIEATERRRSWSRLAGLPDRLVQLRAREATKVAIETQLRVRSKYAAVSGQLLGRFDSVGRAVLIAAVPLSDSEYQVIRKEEDSPAVSLRCVETNLEG